MNNQLEQSISLTSERRENAIALKFIPQYIVALGWGG